MDIVVTDALLVARATTANVWHLALEVTPSGAPMRRLSWVYPEDTMECRAAEYGIDPADRDTLLGVMLWEPHLPDVATVHEHPRWLYHAPSVADARSYLLDRVAAGRGSGALNTRNRRPTETRPTATSHTVMITGVRVGGTFTLTHGGRTTIPIPAAAVADTVRGALEALPNINPGEVTVTGGPGLVTPYTVEFRAASGLSADPAGLTGTNPGVQVTGRGWVGRVLLDSDTDPATPLMLIHRESPIDPAVVAVRAEHTARVRDLVRATRRDMTVLTDAQLRTRPTAAQVRDQLTPRRQDDDPIGVHPS